jgi:hypothetical protein
MRPHGAFHRDRWSLQPLPGVAAKLLQALAILRIAAEKSVASLTGACTASTGASRLAVQTNTRTLLFFFLSATENGLFLARLFAAQPA